MGMPDDEHGPATAPPPGGNDPPDGVGPGESVSDPDLQPLVPPVATPAPGSASAERTPADVTALDDRPGRLSWAGVLAALAVLAAIATVVSTVIDVFGLVGGPPPSSPPSDTLPPPPTAPSWTDPFDDGRIDPERWDLNARPDVIYERGGVLNLDASGAPIGNADGTNPSIVAVSEGQSITEFAFVLTLESILNDDSGGAGGALFDATGREYSAYVGPGAEVHHVEFALCVPGPQGEQCTLTTGPVITIGTPVRVRMAWSGTEVQMYADSSVPVYVAPAPTTPVRALFGMYADGRSAFHVTVDDARLTHG
jgi:hypothetical protein